jgi:hypothetical protein
MAREMELAREMEMARKMEMTREMLKVVDVGIRGKVEIER